MAGIKDGLKIANIQYEPVVVESNQNEDLAIKNLRMLDGMKLGIIYSLSSAATQIVKNIGMARPSSRQLSIIRLASISVPRISVRKSS